MDANEIVLFSSQLRSLEISLVTGNSSPESSKIFSNVTSLHRISGVKELLHLCELIAVSDYESVLNSKILIDYFDSFALGSGERVYDKIFENLRKNIEHCSKNEVSSLAIQYILLFFGVSALQEFIRCNWTGPSQDKSKDFDIIENIFGPGNNSHGQVLKVLDHCGESAYELVNCPNLLLFSKYILNIIDCNIVSRVCTRDWWMLRCLMIHQQILLERSGDLNTELKNLIDKLMQSEFLKTDRSAGLQLNIECGLVHLYYQDITSTKHYFSKARELVGLDFELSGAYAKRTQFQSKAVAQLLIKLERASVTKNAPIIRNNLPKDLALDDEVLLNKVTFVDVEDNTVETLLPEEQLVILSECCLVQRSDASDELLSEKLAAYVDCLLFQPTTWSVQMKSLIMRSKLEKHKSRKVERAMKQMESLLAVIRNENSDLKVRLHLFYSVLFPPCWIIEKEFADLLLSLGAVKSALDVFLRLELWEEIVFCYKSLGQNGKAAEIVRQRLEAGETPLLWCVLGDVTDDVQCYNKAWELSNHCNSRSQSSLGLYHYRKQMYEEAIPHFQKSLAINHLQLNVWFSLAFAATKMKDYELAAKAYRHVVVMDPENFQAWNNLSNAYINLKRKDRAYKTLQEALKCNFEDWRIWENFILICVDVGAFEDALQAYNRLLDLKGKHEDVQVLTILVKAICNDMPDVSGNLSKRLKPKAKHLFGRLTSLCPNNPGIWKQYALLYLSDEDSVTNKDIMEHVVMYQQKAHRFAIQKPNWERDATLCKEIVSDAIEFGSNYLVYLQYLDGNIKAQNKSSAKLMLKNLHVRVEKKLGDFQTSDAEELGHLLRILHSTLCNIELM